MTISAWADIAGEFEGYDNAVLLGNGFSQNIWSGFSYTSLLQVVRDLNVLTGREVALFGNLGSPNFEYVMLRLQEAGIVNTAMEVAETYNGNYQNIKNALVTAVQSIHPHTSFEVPETTKKTICDELKKYRSVFTTNYDLIIYASIFTDPHYSKNFCDYFWSEGSKFDPLNIDLWSNKTSIYYLHGGLHLTKLPGGIERKVSHTGTQNILAQFGTNPPLFVSEGSAQEKKDAIRRSAYLTFCYRKLQTHAGAITLIGKGHEGDEHVISALNDNRKIKKVAIGLHNPNEGAERRWIAALPGVERSKIVFFRSAEHPLGSPTLTIQQDDPAF